MEGGELVEARLVRPPPPPTARLLRPPPRKAGALVGAAMVAARQLPLAWALLAAARLLRAVARLALLVVASGAFLDAVARSGDPIRAAVEVATTPGVWLTGMGLMAAAFIAAALVEITAWAVGLPGLRANLQRAAARRLAAVAPGLPDAAPAAVAQPPPAEGMAGRFAALVQTAALLLLGALVWAAAAVPLVAIAGRTWLAAWDARQGGALLASLALALVLALTLVGSLLLRLVAEAAVARVGAFGERPLPAIYEAAALVLRRPLVFLTALYLLAIAGFLATLAFSVPAALAPPGAAGFVLGVLVEVATAGVTGLLALARLGVFVGAAGDAEGG